MRIDYIFKYFSPLIIFKFLNNGYCNELFTLAPNAYALRHNVNNIIVPFYRTSRGQRSLLYTAPLIWNNLPAHLKTLSNINTFKLQFKRHLLQLQSNEMN